jgi:flagellar protein FlaG
LTRSLNMFNSGIDGISGMNKSASANKTAAGQIALVATSEPKTVSNVDLQVEKDELVGAVKKLNEHVAPALQTIEFYLDQESKRMIVKVVDTETQKVLRQIPNEEVVAMSKTLDKLQGLVIRQTA